MTAAVLPAPPTAATETACAHCGLTVAPGDVDTAQPRQFCCTGCRTAFAILHEHGLGAYYGMADRREAPVRPSGRRYDEFDHPDFARLYVTPAAGGLARTELYLEGVHCASCVWLVERMPLLLPGVARAELDVRRSLAVVEWDAARQPLSAVARALDALGYPPHPFRGVARAAMRRQEDRAMLVRIGVAGAIATNVMLLALVLYSAEGPGMDPALERFFRWASLALTVPALAWPGRVFFTGAWAALRTRSLHMDLPIAIALAAGLVRGAINTVTGHGPIYFDGLAVLVFALLVGRFLQQRGQRLATDSAELRHALAPASARVVEGGAEGGAGGAERTIPVEALLPGMVLAVRAGESFAADGTIVAGGTRVNAALLTGESRPTTAAVGDRVFAGTLNVEAPVRVRVEQAGASSRLAAILQQVEEGARRRAPVVLQANRLAGIFTATVLVLAAVTLAVKVRSGAPHALDDAIALLVVTCPCALALATPLAITMAVGRAAGRGMLVKGGDALELLASPGTLLLDKTGTLTEGRTALVAWHGDPSVRALVLALEAGSSHPLADAFRRAWPDVAVPETSDVRHVVGAGIEGMVAGRRVRVGSPRFAAEVARAVSPRAADAAGNPVAVPEEATPVHVTVDGVLVAVAGVGDAIRADAAAALATLRARGWRTRLLSGDAPEVAAAVGRRLGFAPGDVIGGASPEAKLAAVQREKARVAGGGRVVMVGDGVNDAAAMAAADVGIGVHGGAEACLATADIYLTRPGLAPLVELTEGAARTLRVIRRNIGFSIGYNLIGASLAVAGVLTPLIAAILMPTASVTVVLGSWLGFTFARARVAPEGS